MEKKRTGLRSYIRSNLPIELVNFLKKKGILTDFIQTFLSATSGYINQKEVFTRNIDTQDEGAMVDGKPVTELNKNLRDVPK